MTDERMGDGLWSALERLPRGSGVVFRHYALARAERVSLFRRIAKIARKRRLLLLRAGTCALPGEQGVHGAPGRGFVSWAVHDRAAAVTARRAGAALVFVSPIFATASHPGARTLGRVRGGLLVREIRSPVIALGGIDADRAKALRGLGFHGWGAIDAWMHD
jgi:thiamine-phosphate pyrophosphorylase